MSQEEFEQRPTSPAPIGHEFRAPIVEELPRDTPWSKRERVNASNGDTSETTAEVDS